MSSKRRFGWVLATLSAALWTAAGWVGLKFDGVTGPAIVLGWIIICALPLTVAASVLIALGRREEAQQRRGQAR
jgi:hypothetical protein